MPAKAEPSGEKSYTRSIIRCCEEPQEEDGDNGGTSGEESHQLHQMHLSPNGEEGNAAVREAQQQPQHATAVIPEISGQEGVAQRPSAGNNNAAADGDDQYTEPTASVVSTSGYNTNTSSAASNHQGILAATRPTV